MLLEAVVQDCWLGRIFLLMKKRVNVEAFAGTWERERLVRGNGSRPNIHNELCHTPPIDCRNALWLEL